MRITMTTETDPAEVRAELMRACAAVPPDEHGRSLCAQRVWRELLAGGLDDDGVAATWGPLPERDRQHRGRSVARLAFDAAWAAAGTDGPWWVDWMPLEAA